ncbi:MAG: tyrosine-type recombinase/integrase [Candidatus Cybelea sp.]
MNIVTRILLWAATKAFKAAALRAGISGVGLHSLRHTGITLSLGHGIDVRTVATLAGHASPAMTLDRYGHAISGLAAKAIDALDAALDHAQRRRAGSENRGA